MIDLTQDLCILNPMTYSMFLDDLREISDVYRDSPDMVVIRSSQTAIQYVLKHGLPEFISFDHDLGGDDTSMRFLRWMEYETNYIQTFQPPRYHVHSANPVGVENIKSFMRSWEKIST